MGVLTENSPGQGFLTNILKNHASKLSFLSYIGGVLWFLSLAWEPNNNRTYFSENALLPALNQREFQFGGLTNQYFNVLKEEAGKDEGIPYPYLQAQFRQLGLDVYLHNFTLNYPFGSKSSHEGVNLYAILRAPRSAGLEALVLSAPYRNENSIHGSTLPSVAMMLSLAKFFRQQIYLAKDLIFLIADHELVGFQAWLKAYHSVEVSKTEALDSGFLSGRSGAIQAAINLELQSDKLSHIDVAIEGLNGQLPNLDLFNLVLELCPRENVVPTFHGFPNPAESESWNGYQIALQTMLSMMVAQGTGAPSGAHGLFHRYAIQALTLKGYPTGFDFPKATFNQVGRVIEGIFRSLNNLLERFHQSFFFYLLPACRRYVSIGLYMPPFGLIVAPALFQALSIYLSMDDNIFSSQKKVKGGTGSLWSALPYVITVVLLGYGMVRLPELLDMLGHEYGLTFKDSLYYGLIAYMLAIQILPAFFLMRRKLKLKERQCYKCVALLALGAILFTLALINISTATFIAVLYIPIATLTSTFKYRILRFFQTLLLFLIQPLAVTYIIILITHLLDPNPFPEEANPGFKDYLATSVRGHKNLVLWNIEDWHLYQSYNFVGFSAVLTPVWLLFWYLPPA